MSFREAKTAHPNLNVEEFLVRGAFPELYANLDIDARGYLQSYVATYLERDLRQLLEVSSLRDFERFLRACAIRSGHLLNRADLARDVGIVGSTAAAWLSVLQASHQLVLLEPWFGNATVSLVKSPKLYLREPGLAAFLCGVHGVEDLRGSPLAGALWETLVCAEIRRTQASRLGGWQLNFWRDRTREADFLTHRGGRFHLADAKWAEQPRLRDAAGLRKVSAALSPNPVDTLSVICRTPNTHPIDARVNAVPVTDLPGAFSGE